MQNQIRDKPEQILKIAYMNRMYLPLTFRTKKIRDEVYEEIHKYIDAGVNSYQLEGLTIVIPHIAFVKKGDRYE